jgi:brefeldin A-inhibited guanine nucleotide-exchange protein
VRQDTADGPTAAAAAKGGGGWMDTILNLIPGRRAAASNEPSEEAVRRLHDTLRCAPGRPRR